jgi:hypothetical protein
MGCGLKVSPNHYTLIAGRVVKPGGKIVIVDYAQPCWWHPHAISGVSCLGPLSPTRSTCGVTTSRRGCQPAGGARLAQAKGFFGLYKMTSFIRSDTVTALGSVGARPVRRLPQSDSHFAVGSHIYRVEQGLTYVK